MLLLFCLAFQSPIALCLKLDLCENSKQKNLLHLVCDLILVSHISNLVLLGLQESFECTKCRGKNANPITNGRCLNYEGCAFIATISESALSFRKASCEANVARLFRLDKLAQCNIALRSCCSCFTFAA